MVERSVNHLIGIWDTFLRINMVLELKVHKNIRVGEMLNKYPITVGKV
jgi:hypothetical protein